MELFSTGKGTQSFNSMSILPIQPSVSKKYNIEIEETEQTEQEKQILMFCESMYFFEFAKSYSIIYF
jgi:hypothetical protein